MKYKVTLNDKVYEVEVERGEAVLVDEYAAAAPAPAVPAAAPVAAPVAAGEMVPSPLAGKIFKILKNVGDAVNEGDPVINIEAMKMENEIVAPRAGTVAQIVVAAGDTVKSGDPLFVLN